MGEIKHNPKKLEKENQKNYITIPKMISNGSGQAQNDTKRAGKFILFKQLKKKYYRKTIDGRLTDDDDDG